MTCSREISFADSAGIDAFSRLRVSDANLMWQVQCQYNTEALYMEGGTTGTGVAPVHSANTRMVTLSATAGSGTSFFQSYEYIPYIPGRSQLIFITGLLDGAVVGAVKDVGIFDAANGIFLRQNGTSGLQIVRRSSTSGSIVDEVVSQASWNQDPLNGGGISGIILNPSAVYILVIDAQFLAMGRVRVGFDIGGVVVWAHHFNHSNIIAVPYMQTLTLPVQCLLTATSTGSTAYTYFKCASVSSEGGDLQMLGHSHHTPDVTVSAGSATATHLLSLRPATTFNALTNRTHVTLDSVDLLVTGNFSVQWQLCLGATFSAAPTWTAVNGTYSSCEYTSTAGTLATAGTVCIASGYIASAASNKGASTMKAVGHYPITLNRAGAQTAQGTLSLIVTGIGGASATRAVFNFTEVR